MSARGIEEVAVTLKNDDIVCADRTLTRKQAVTILGMNDTEFALRLIWDSAFPKPLAGAFRETDLLAWKDAQRAGARNKSAGNA
jgi:hypothetical protein